MTLLILEDHLPKGTTVPLSNLVASLFFSSSPFSIHVYSRISPISNMLLEIVIWGPISFPTKKKCFSNRKKFLTINFSSVTDLSIIFSYSLAALYHPTLLVSLPLLCRFVLLFLATIKSRNSIVLRIDSISHALKVSDVGLVVIFSLKTM